MPIMQTHYNIILSGHGRAVLLYAQASYPCLHELPVPVREALHPWFHMSYSNMIVQCM
jgi:hypothetical protein